MMHLLVKVLRVILGVFLYAVGVVLTMEARIGFAPWEVFHAGLGNVLNIQIGTVSSAVGLVLLIITAVYKERVGLGSLLNIISIGVFLNMILNAGVIPTADTLPIALLQMTLGLAIIAFGTYLYISAGLGAGPRDSFMVLLNRKSGIKVGVVRSLIEVTVTLLGVLMGGLFGWGTIFAAVVVGVALQTVFRIFKFDPRTIEHEDLKTTLTSMLNKPVL